MAYIDAELEFSDGQAVTATAISENVVDLGATPTLRDIGAGEPMWLVVNVGTAFTAAGAATLTITLESDSTADLATSATTHWTSATIPKASLTANTNIVKQPLPSEVTYERYLGLRYTVATGPMTAGTLDAFITKDYEQLNSYPAETGT